MDQLSSDGNNVTLSRGQRLGVWAGVAGAIIGCTAWLLAMAVLSHDWATVLLTLALDAAALFLFGRLCLRHAKSRFLYLASLLVLLTAHCIIMYWWRLDIWRASLNLDAAELVKQKKMVSITVSCMVAILLAQLLLMHWLQNRSRRR
jgi:hypothetical protein